MSRGGEARPVFPLGSQQRLSDRGSLPPSAAARLDPSRLDRPVTDIHGVGRRTAERLAGLGVRTIGELLHHIPFRHEQPASLVPVSCLKEGEEATIRVRVQSSSMRRTRRRGLKILEAILGDETASIKGTWYNQAYLQEAFQRRPEILVRGRLTRRRGEVAFAVRAHEILTDRGDGDDADGVHTLGLVPVYPATGELSVKLIRTLLSRALPEAAHSVDPVPSRVLASNGYLKRADALAVVHFPGTAASARAARDRLAFEELLLLQVALLRRRAIERDRRRATPLEDKGALSGRFLDALPFHPTDAQRRVIEEIDGDIERARPMRRLLQGDVGSGKTLVATYALLRGVESGGQSVMMAPTEVLADQHAVRLTEQLAPVGVEPVLLKGSQPAAERRQALTAIEQGRARLVVGTHALIQKGVEFRNLRLAVVDEQHRFGVEQRDVLASGADDGVSPHILHMTATPIPRTLSLTLYGDLDVSVIDELPPGRTPVKTRLVRDDAVAKMWEFVRRELQRGRQTYVVCPLIEESEDLCAASATATHRELSSGWLRDFRVGLLHGQLPAGEKRQTMEAFDCGDLDVLVSTTVIEVGVDVQNASVMVIEGAWRFGLSQLHQLRGRVGRGAAASYCLLRAEHGTDEEALKRLALFARTCDGFELAEADLSLRGEGQLFGERQSGMGDLKVARLLTDGRLLERARQTAREILETDPELVRPEHRLLAEASARRFGAEVAWLDRA